MTTYSYEMGTVMTTMTRRHWTTTTIITTLDDEPPSTMMPLLHLTVDRPLLMGVLLFLMELCT